jgi:uncharacterized RDD family membrane protein YckC
MSNTTWYAFHQGKEEGPFSEQELKEKFSSGEYDNEILLWNESLLEWKKAKTLSLFPNKRAVVPIEKKVVSQIRPWIRYWARQIDLLIWVLFIGILLPILPVIDEMTLGFLILSSWALIESILLSTLGTTPGKWFLKIKLLHANGAKLSFSEALHRSFSVWVMGMGCGVPLVNIFALSYSYFSLKRKGATLWDQEKYTVSHEPIGKLRGTLLLALLLSIIACILFVLVASESAQIPKGDWI